MFSPSISLRELNSIKGTIRLFLVCVLWFSISQVNAQLSGTYTIGGTSPDYTTINLAVSALASSGVNGPVVFNIRPGIYSEQVSIPGISGASTVNTVTFQSVGLDSSTVTIEHNTLNSLNNYVIRFNGAQYVHLKHLSVKAFGSNSLRVAVWMSSQASHNSITHSDISSPTTSGSSSLASTILLFGSGMSNLTLSNNRISGGARQLEITGSNSTTNISGVQILNNSFEGNAAASLSVYGINGLLISGNSFTGYRSAGSGTALELRYCSNNIIIEKNRIDLSGGTGVNISMDIKFCNATSGNPIILRNNFIALTGQQYVCGIDIGVCSYVNILNNSFHVAQNTSLSRFLNTSVSVSNIEILNNAFRSDFDTEVIVASQAPTGQFVADYNSYYSAKSSAFKISGTSLTFADWQSTYGQDSHSILADPYFVSPSDLHVNNAADLNNAGFSTPFVTEDIDGEPRNLLTPDIGADEFDIDSLTFRDIGLVAVVSPDTNACQAIDSLLIQVVNNSMFTIDSFKVKWYTFGFFVDSLMVTDTVAAGDTLLVDLGPYTFAPNTVNEMRFEISDPNGLGDNFNGNNYREVDYFNFDNAKIFTATDPNCNGNTVLYLKDFPRASVQWSTGSTQDQITVSQPGTYSVSVTSNHGCVITDTLTF